MFQMIDQSSAEPADRKMLLYKIGMFIVALAAVGGCYISLHAVPKLSTGYRRVNGKLLF